MGQGVKRTQRDYSLTFKLALVEQIEKGELTYKQAQVRYGIQGRSTVLVWLRKHGRQDWSQGASVRAGRSITMPDPDNQTPEQRIKELEREVRENEERYDRQMAAMRRLLGAGGQAFVTFLRNAGRRLDECAALLEEFFVRQRS